MEESTLPFSTLLYDLSLAHQSQIQSAGKHEPFQMGKGSLWPAAAEDGGAPTAATGSLLWPKRHLPPCKGCLWRRHQIFLPTLAIAAAVTDASDEASQPQCLCGGGNPVQCYSGAGHCIWDTIKPAPGPSQKQHLENSKLKFTWRAISDCAPKQQTAIKQWQTEAVWIIDYLWFAWWTGKAKKICSRLTRSYSAFPYAKWSWKKSKQTTTKKGFVFNWNSFRPAFNFGGFFLYPLKKWSIYPN